jgi:hypothetical protein
MHPEIARRIAAQHQAELTELRHGPAGPRPARPRGWRRGGE